MGVKQGPVVVAPMCSITGAVTVPSEATVGVPSKVAINTVVADTHGWWDTTNKRYVPKLAGRYLCVANFVGGAYSATNSYLDLVVAKNGAAVSAGAQRSLQTGGSIMGPEVSVVTTVVMNGSTDYLEYWGGYYTGGSTTMAASAEQFDIFYLGPV